MNEQQKALFEHQSKLKRGAAIIEGTQEKFRQDGYSNMLNKYGTKQDNSTAYTFQGELITDDIQLSNLYVGNGLFAKIINRPAEEAVKHGLDIDFGNDDIKEYVTDTLDELDYENKFATAEKWARLYGGAIIVMLVDDSRGLEEPLDWKNVRSIEELLVYERAIVQPDYTSMYRFSTLNPLLNKGRKVGEPEYYQVSSIYGSFIVHRTRCLVFKNGDLPEHHVANANYRYWGVPEYVKIKRALRECITSHEDSVKLLERSVQAIYSMKNLANMLATDAGEDKVLQRLQVIDMARGILNSIAIDNDGEEYRYENLSLSGVKDVVDATCNMLSAVTDIPQTILFGRSPAGMNSTGESDFENFYNMVENIQKQNMKKNTRTVIDLILKQGMADGSISENPKYKVKFAALWSMSDAEQANVDKTKADTEHVKAQTAQVYMDSNVLDPAEVRNSLASEGCFNIEEVLTDNDLELPEDTFDLGETISISGIDTESAEKTDDSVESDDDSADIISIQGFEDDDCEADTIRIRTDNLDGGPGSGNWGHQGRQGKRGGSTGGGGVKNRTGTKDTGFSSESKERMKAKKSGGGNTSKASVKSSSSYEGEVADGLTRQLYTNKKSEFSKNAGKDISDNEVEAMVGAVKHYGLGGECQMILSTQNPKLYSDLYSDMSADEITEYGKKAENIERYIQYSDKVEKAIHRGITFNSEYFDGNIDDVLSNLEEGKEISMGHIASWSTNKGTAKSYSFGSVDAEFEDGENYSIVYSVGKPKSAASLAGINPEGECLTPKSAKFKVKSVDYFYDDDYECHIYNVELEEE